MKKTLPLIFFLLSFSGIFAQNYYMTAPEGFGAAATGGGTPTSANTVTVTTYDQLTAALISKTTATSVILVSGIIDFPKQYKVTLSNKTIIGLPGARFRNTQIFIGDSPASRAVSGILYIQKTSNNVIIRNLIFQGPGAYDVDGEDNLINEGTNVWVDHCEFQDGMDGNFDIKGSADNTTVSWCKFIYLKAATPGGSGGSADHRFSGLVGSGVADAPADGRFSVTFKNCYWADGCKERMPRARNAELHILNCYYKTSVSSSRAIALGAGNNGTTCYVENCNFEQIATVSNPVNEGTDATNVGLTAVNCVRGIPSLAVNPSYGKTISKPSYAYTVLPVANVAGFVSDASCGAGATLQVSSNGEISTSCANLGVNDNTSNLELQFYPTVIDNILNIQFSSIENGSAVIEIYSVNGNKVYTSSKTVTGNEKVELNITNLAKGVYICKVQIENRVKTFKVVKN